MNSPASIRRSLLIRLGIGISILLCVLSIWIYITVRHTLYQEMDRAITQTAAMLSNQVELENGEINFEWQEGLGTNQSLIDDGLFQFWDESTGHTTRSPGLHDFDLPKFCGDGTRPVVKDIKLPKNNRHARAIGIRVYPFLAPHEPGDGKALTQVIDPKTRPHILVVARDAKGIHRVLNRIRWILSGGTLLTLGISYLLIVRAIRSSLHPIHQLTRQVKSRSERQLDSALDLPEKIPVELTGLAESFDSLLSRLSSVRQRERDFIRHAAHELRTPIAALRATTDLALSRSRDAAAYAEHLAICQKTAVELSELVQRLTALARIDQSPSPSLERLDLAALFMNCADSFSAALQERNLTLQIDFPSTPLTALGDATLLRIIFNNLLDNAISYASPGGKICVQGNLSASHAEIRIANPTELFPENLDRLFEPLFRIESSRQDAADHLGIGLALSQDAANAMNATLQAAKTDEGWIEFVLKLPC